MDESHNEVLPSFRILSTEKVDHETRLVKWDAVAEEMPLQVLLKYGPLEDRKLRTYTIMMRTPGHDFDLILGNLYSEGIIKQYSDVMDIAFSDKESEDSFVITEAMVDLLPSVLVKFVDRNVISYGSCGLCSRSAMEGYLDQFDFLIQKNGLSVTKTLLSSCSKYLNQPNSLFSRTGGVHSCAILTEKGHTLDFAEDIGRHNALDKLIGMQIKNGRLPLDSFILQLSGRISFELVQKAAMAGIPIIIAFGAPSTAAIELANKMKITLIGFLKSHSYSIYTHADRVI
jgi:FdhD protein